MDGLAGKPDYHFTAFTEYIIGEGMLGRIGATNLRLLSNAAKDCMSRGFIRFVSLFGNLNRSFNDYSPERIAQARKDMVRLQRLDQYGELG